jgi:hypothetical protein
MNFYTTLLEQYTLLESLETTIKANPSIPEQTIRNYHTNALPDNNKNDRLLNHVLKLHNSGAITPETAHLLKPHLTALSNTNQLQQLKHLNTLDDHISATKDIADKAVTKKQKIDINTPTVFENDDIIIKHHKTHESAIKGATLDRSNPLYKETREPGKAQWCVSTDNENGANYFNRYTDNGQHPLYSTLNKKTKRKSMLLADPNKELHNIEFRSETDGNIAVDTPSLYHYMQDNPGVEHTPVGKYLLEKDTKLKPLMQKINAKTTSEELNDILKTGTLEEKTIAVTHPKFNNKHIQTMLDIGDYDSMKLLKPILRNTPLSNSTINKALDSEFNVVGAVLGNPSLTSEHIDKIVKGDYPIYIQREALDHPFTTEGNLNNAIDANHTLATYALLHQKARLPQLNDALKKYPRHPEIVNNILGHPDSTLAHVEHAVKMYNPNVAEKIFKHPEARLAHLYDLHKNGVKIDNDALSAVSTFMNRMKSKTHPDHEEYMKLAGDL